MGSRSPYLLILALLSGGCPALSLSAREMYTSNSIGAVIRLVPPDTPLTYAEYILIVDDDTDARVERLYHKGTLTRRTRSVVAGRVRTEYIYISGVLKEENMYDSDERLLSAVTYGIDEEPLKSISYTYRQGSVSVEHRDGEQTLLFSERRQLDQSGRITELVREHNNENQRKEVVQFIFLDRQLLREIHRFEDRILDDLTLIIQYDSYGRLIREEHYTEDTLQKEIDYTYDVPFSDRIPNTVSTIEHADDVVTRQQRTNNAAGQKIAQLSYENDILVEEAAFTYDQERLRSARIHRTGSTSQQELVYDDAGEVAEENWYDNGLLVRSVSEAVDGNHVELRYANEIPYVRIFFENGTRVKEEFLSEDAVIRERTLE